jgi:SPX domain protein involved in polyphosphate accumulation
MIIQRTELKYFVPLQIYSDLRKDLSHFMKKDKNTKEGHRAYDVHSIYFDTRNFRYYNDKIDGIEVRQKFRIRYYDPEVIAQKKGNLWLELKAKDGPIIKKSRHKIDYLDKIGPFEFNKTSSKELDTIMYILNRDNLAPVVRVSYRREALVGIYERDTRITFDSEITGASTIGNSYYRTSRDVRLLSPFQYLLEIKISDAIPSWLSHLIEKYNLEQTAYSKYANAIEKTGTLRKFKGELYE